MISLIFCQQQLSQMELWWVPVNQLLYLCRKQVINTGGCQRSVKSFLCSWHDHRNECCRFLFLSPPQLLQCDTTQVSLVTHVGNLLFMSQVRVRCLMINMNSLMLLQGSRGDKGQKGVKGDSGMPGPPGLPGRVGLVVRNNNKNINATTTILVLLLSLLLPLLLLLLLLLLLSSSSF